MQKRLSGGGNWCTCHFMHNKQFLQCTAHCAGRDIWMQFLRSLTFEALQTVKDYHWSKHQKLEPGAWDKPGSWSMEPGTWKGFEELQSIMWCLNPRENASVQVDLCLMLNFAVVVGSQLCMHATSFSSNRVECPDIFWNLWMCNYQYTYCIIESQFYFSFFLWILCEWMYLSQSYWRRWHLTKTSKLSHAKIT